VPQYLLQTLLFTYDSAHGLLQTLLFKYDAPLLRGDSHFVRADPQGIGAFTYTWFRDPHGTDAATHPNIIQTLLFTYDGAQSSIIGFVYKLLMQAEEDHGLLCEGTMVGE